MAGRFAKSHLFAVLRVVHRAWEVMYTECTSVVKGFPQCTATGGRKEVQATTIQVHPTPFQIIGV